ncbi:MAG: lysine biosynthesis protein LysW [Halobacteriales archaeon]|nr:lysine biosynthesis protein LysW [Halobacteriales archaeon]
MATQGTGCVECGETLSLPDDVEMGEIGECSISGGELEVIDLDPITVEPAPELEADWGE